MCFTVMEENGFDFGELSQDENFKQKIISFNKEVDNASNMLKNFFEKFKYDELSPEDKVRYNLFLAFSINSYFWMYLRLRGVDPNQHELKEQINRVREYMNKSREVYEKKTLMPRVDQGAAKRFVKSGLWMAKNSKEAVSKSADSETEVPVKRKK